MQLYEAKEQQVRMAGQQRASEETKDMVEKQTREEAESKEGGRQLVRRLFEAEKKAETSVKGRDLINPHRKRRKNQSGIKLQIDD